MLHDSVIIFSQKGTDQERISGLCGNHIWKARIRYSLLRCALYVCVCLVFPTALSAKDYRPSEVPNVQVEDYRQFVSDPTEHFTMEEKADLNQLLYDIRERHTAEIVLVVLPGVEYDDPESFTLELFRLWGIGKKADNNGLLILYVYGAPGERIIRFETGYGLEGALPDITTKRLTNKYLVPLINEGKDAEAFRQTFVAIDQILSEEYEARNDGNTLFYETEQDEALHNTLFAYLGTSLLIGLLVAIGLYVRWGKEKEPVLQQTTLNNAISRSGWFVLILPALAIFLPIYLMLKRRTTQSITLCPRCHTKGSVALVPRSIAKNYLSGTQEAEDRVGSIHYKVYKCNQCDYQRIAKERVALSGYVTCPICGARTYRKEDQHQVRNKLIETYKCAYCGHTKTEVTRLLNNGGGPFLGGGLGGGSHSGGFGGGFGGGASGGGGSTTRF